MIVNLINNLRLRFIEQTGLPPLYLYIHATNPETFVKNLSDNPVFVAAASLNTRGDILLDTGPTIFGMELKVVKGDTDELEASRGATAIREPLVPTLLPDSEIFYRALAYFTTKVIHPCILTIYTHLSADEVNAALMDPAQPLFATTLKLNDQHFLVEGCAVQVATGEEGQYSFTAGEASMYFDYLGTIRQ